MEDFLRQADRRFQQFLKDAGRERRQVERVVRVRADEAIRKGAGGLRQRLDDLHDGVEALSARLSKIEGRRTDGAKPVAAKPARKPGARKLVARKAAGRRATRKKAA